MSLLDKQTMYFFRKEMEKQALLAEPLIGFGKIVSAAGKAATQGAGNYAKAMTNLSAAGGPIRARDYLGGIALGGTALYAGKKGLDAVKKDAADGRMRESTGIQDLRNLGV